MLRSLNQERRRGQVTKTGKAPASLQAAVLDYELEMVRAGQASCWW